MIEIVEHVIDPARVLAAVGDPRCGAGVLFIGTTRAITEDRETVSLEYECYREMALSALRDLAEQARGRWSIAKVAIVHRIGNVPVGESSVAIAVSAPHRDAAFAAGKWLIDTLKEVVPIWKREQYANGLTEWQHPSSASLRCP